ncbi:unnamed protein product [Discula destructiva]
MKWWGKDIHKCLDAREKSIPKQWLLPADKLPGKDQHNVLDVPLTSGVLTEEEIEITKQDVADLLKAYQDGKWTVRQVVTAFLKQSVIIHQLTNFATEFLTSEALTRADELDAHFAATGTLLGPLHGIPVSVKEQLALANHLNTSGCAALINAAPPTEDAHLVRLFRAAGAVLHVRTNVPQSLMHLDCANNIFGTTLNPRDLRLSPGGSSGGEGVSLGARCAVLGIGTDIGGSVRIPAAFNECYGLRPTALRIPVLGHTGVSGGQESIRGVAGPLAKSVEGLEVWMKTVLDQEPWEYETSLMPVPWKEDVKLEEFTVGVMWDDDIVKPHPPVLRALQVAVDKLKAAGVKVVDWAPYDHQRGWDIIAPLYFPEAGQRWLAAFAQTGEPILPLTQHALDFSRSTGKVPLSVPDNWDLNVARETYRREHHALMRARGVDFILCPAYAGAGVLQGGARYWHYTSVWNILDLPAVVVPSGVRCEKAVDVKEEGYGARARSAKDEEEWAAYDPELFDGFPVALQLVGKRFRDEDVLAAAKVLDKALKDEK